MEKVEVIQQLADHIFDSLDESITGYVIDSNELIMEARHDRIKDVLKFLKTDSRCKFTMLMDICGVDYPEKENRFSVVYNLLSLTNNQRIRIKTAVADGTIIPSVTDIFRSAGWYEREVWDMFGIAFSEHPDLRRILTDYDFEGHPLRKDFPLTGFTQVRYDEEKQRIIHEDVSLDQEYREFGTLSPLQAMTDVQIRTIQEEENTNEKKVS